MVEMSLEDELNSLMQDATVDPAAADPVAVEEDKTASTASENETTAEKHARERDQSGRFVTKKDESAADPALQQPAPAPEIPPPPQGISSKIKEKWAQIDPELRNEIIRREEDVHKRFTSQDDERSFGKKIKEVVNPYMHIIQAEGGTAEGAVRDLLNTAYLLRSADPARKAEMVRQIIQTYGVDINLVSSGSQQAGSPDVTALNQRLDRIQQSANPEIIFKQLQDRIEDAKIQSEVKTFAADKAHVHFEVVKADMAALLGAGQAKELREAYDKACWANPEIRSTLLAKQKADDQAKQKADIESKKRAAVSITGSRAAKASSTSANANPQSLEDELRSQWDATEAGL